MSHEHTYSATVEKKEKSTVLITVEIPAEILTDHRKYALESLGEQVEIDGFRKGKIPEKVLVQKLGEMAILTEAAEMTIRHTYPHIVHDKNIDAIGAPEITITKLAEGNPLGFTALVAVLPEVTLPDYKAIAIEKNKKKETAEVTDAEVDTAIEQLLRQKMAYERVQEAAKKKKMAEEAGLTLPTPETADSEEDFSKLPLPELTDEYVTTLGKFTSVVDFKTQLRTHIENEKKAEVVGAHRALVTDAIIEKSAIDLPDILIQTEIDQMFGQMESDLARANLTIESYLEHIKKTREELTTEWTPAAEKKAKLQLVLNEIAKKETVEPDKAAVEHEMEHILSLYKDANQERARIYVESVLRNEAVMKMLETLS